MIRVFILLTALFAFPSQAQEVVCEAFGENVPIIAMSAEKMGLQYGTGEGAAWVDASGSPIIVYDEALDTNPVIKNHVIAHECGHHQIGHVRQAMRGYYTENESGELAVDCIGIKILRDQLGYGRDETIEIAKFIKNRPYLGGTMRAFALMRCGR